MKLFSNKKILALAVLVSCSSINVYATNSHFKYGCHNSGNTPAPPTESTCDTWTGDRNYDLYLENPNSNHYDSTRENIDEGYDFQTASTVKIDGVQIKVSGWSDTYGNNDDKVVEASIAGPWSNNDSNNPEYGYGIINNDERDFDNHNGYHTVDNKGDWSDYDMVLFSFSSEVQLDGATFSHLIGSVETQQITVVGLNDIGALTNGSSTWSEIASSNNSDFVSAGSFQIEKCDDVYISNFTSNDTAKYWLIGAYNSAIAYVDGFTENDGFKLASVGFKTKTLDPGTKPPTDVNAPSSFALLILGGGLMAWRRRKA